MVNKKGFTLIELLVVITLISILLAIAQPSYRNTILRAKEAVLKENLATIRDAVDKYYSDKGKYPDSLEVLVSEKYLKGIPSDPITQSQTTWITAPPPDGEEGGIYNVTSGSEQTGSDGKPYKEW